MASNSTDILNAIRGDDARAFVQAQKDHPVDINQAISAEILQIPLHYAASLGSRKVVDTLIQQGARVDNAFTQAISSADNPSPELRQLFLAIHAFCEGIIAGSINQVACSRRLNELENQFLAVQGRYEQQLIDGSRRYEQQLMAQVGNGNLSQEEADARKLAHKEELSRIRLILKKMEPFKNRLLNKERHASAAERRDLAKQESILFLNSIALLSSELGEASARLQVACSTPKPNESHEAQAARKAQTAAVNEFVEGLNGVSEGNIGVIHPYVQHRIALQMNVIAGQAETGSIGAIDSFLAGWKALVELPVYSQNVLELLMSARNRLGLAMPEMAHFRNLQPLRREDFSHFLTELLKEGSILSNTPEARAIVEALYDILQQAVEEDFIIPQQIAAILRSPALTANDLRPIAEWLQGLRFTIPNLRPETLNNGLEGSVGTGSIETTIPVIVPTMTNVSNPTPISALQPAPQTIVIPPQLLQRNPVGNVGQLMPGNDPFAVQSGSIGRDNFNGLSSLYYGLRGVSAHLRAPKGHQHISKVALKLLEQQLNALCADHAKGPAAQFKFKDGRTVWQTLNPPEGRFQAGSLLMTRQLNPPHGVIHPLEEAIRKHEQYEAIFKAKFAAGQIYEPPEAHGKYYFQQGANGRIHLKLTAGQSLSLSEVRKAQETLVVICQDMTGRLDVSLHVHDHPLSRQSKVRQTIATMGFALGATFDTAEQVGYKDREVQQQVITQVKKMRSDPAASLSDSLVDESKDEKALLAEALAKDSRLMTASGRIAPKELRDNPDAPENAELRDYYATISVLAQDRANWGYLNGLAVSVNVLRDMREDTWKKERVYLNVSPILPLANNPEYREIANATQCIRQSIVNKTRSQREIDERYTFFSSEIKELTQSVDSRHERAQMLSESDERARFADTSEDVSDEELPKSEDESDSSTEQYSIRRLPIDAESKPEEQVEPPERGELIHRSLPKSSCGVPDSQNGQPHRNTPPSEHTSEQPIVRLSASSYSREREATVTEQSSLWSSVSISSRSKYNTRRFDDDGSASSYRFTSEGPEFKVEEEPVPYVSEGEAAEMSEKAQEALAMQYSIITHDQAYGNRNFENDNIIGGYEFEDVPADGSCFYHALTLQIEKVGLKLRGYPSDRDQQHHFLRQQVGGPRATPIGGSRAVPNSEPKYEDIEAEDIYNAARRFNCVIAVIDTGSIKDGFRYYFGTQEQPFQHPLKEELPADKKVLYLAYTGRHYKSVDKQPSPIALPTGYLGSLPSTTRIPSSSLTSPFSFMPPPPEKLQPLVQPNSHIVYLSTSTKK